ncbi:Valine--tRNA ligase [Candidatus Annandia adelgestsuga]|uniref:Valine--tRNA ligase n=1 Tax=Candidatus Annandia adelgestsuga TaxID=1302411 RepID=A0A3Q9CLH5_9ENTR|nr:valine--tRNA ligase [Candidatus Annandia adelgestsuga]AZP36310.1 Valine--tRNA ligase [Candidatus Annandia adelgestsuga]
MDKIYNPKKIEKFIYRKWESEGYFKTDMNCNKNNFCIMMPPPNITGNLHMGHAFQQTIMDIIIRYQKMNGKNTLWKAGLDHAGIATQLLVENKIKKKKNKLRNNYNRNYLIKEILKWKEYSSNNIIKQMKRLGNSVDWNNCRFTMDNNFSLSVRTAFINLYNNKLIYKGKRLVNWDIKLNTAISDLEVENIEIKGYVYYIKYILLNNIKTKNNKKYLIISTTRPETLLGDVAVAVNPKDNRYKNLIGYQVILPIINRIIPIIGDDSIDMKKHTGCVKITPAHDFNDYNIGIKHKLPIINILNKKGFIKKKAKIYNDNNFNIDYKKIIIPKKYQNVDRFIARKKIIEEIKNLKLLKNIKKKKIFVPLGDRSGSIIEPLITNQWYLKTSNLSKKAIKIVKKKKIEFIPKEYEKVYYSWMYNIKDWCISRQLWWGHRIPAWYDKNNKIYVGNNEKEIRIKYNLNNKNILYQDKDVLDTWFSSSLWTFASLGWPNKENYLNNFHPTKILITGFDIIFFWIARMIMLTMYFIKDSNGKSQIPFKKIYITGLIKDENGYKMSKSKGNIIDPIDVIDGINLKNLLKKRTENMIKNKLVKKIIYETKKKFPYGIKSSGADALRFTLSSISSINRNINLDINKITGYRNFCNKLWNASRFVLFNTKKKNYKNNIKIKKNYKINIWIIVKLNNLIKKYRINLDNYRFDLASNVLYDFIWNEFCDWYIELIKPILKYGSKLEKFKTKYILINVLEIILRLSHPIIPFITEKIWQKIFFLKNIKKKTIMLQKFPKYNLKKKNKLILIQMNLLKKIIIIIRNLRYKYKISNKKSIKIFLYEKKHFLFLYQNENILKKILNLKKIIYLFRDIEIKKFITRIIDNTKIIINIDNKININYELKELNKCKNNLLKEIIYLEEQLNNKNFILKAPKNILNKNKKRLLLCKKIKQKINIKIKELKQK